MNPIIADAKIESVQFVGKVWQSWIGKNALFALPE